MNERKIFNFESVILNDLTIEKEGYHPDSLGRSSGKFIFATCRYCGEPSRVRKGFFNKAGSACHRECRIEEQRILSPFKNPETQKLAHERITQKYGPKREAIARKISATKSTPESQAKTKATNQKLYGVDNVFQAEEIKQKTRETNLSKRGVEHIAKCPIAREVRQNTLLEKYGADNPMRVEAFKRQAFETNVIRYGNKSPMQNADIKAKSVEGRLNAIDITDNPYYKMVNHLRKNDEMWDLLKDKTISEICDLYDLKYKSLNSALNRDEFRDRYQATYTFPRTQLQKQILDIVKEMGINAEFNNKTQIYPLELDIYIPELKFAIEFNGSYWHSEAVLATQDSRNKHFSKTKACEEKGIRLFHIFEHDWKDRKSQILNFIKTILGRNTINIAARKCELRIESPSPANKAFMDENHIQGSTTAIKYFNLIYNGELVASMTAARHHRQGANEKHLVLSRLCFKDGYNVQGGSSKLFKGFKRWATEHGYNKIISWSDNCYTQGNIYKVLGFELEEEFGPDYFYFSPAEQRYLSKQSQRKKATNCPDHLTEREWCLERGLYRIYDSGKKRWVYTLE